MICRRLPKLRLVFFEQLADDLSAVDTILARATFEVDAVYVPDVVISRTDEFELVVLLRANRTEHPLSKEVQEDVEELFVRLIEFLEEAR